MPGIWDQLTGAGQGGGFMSNPLLMAGLQTMGAASGGDPIGPAMARGFEGAGRSQMQSRQMQMQQLQMRNLAEDRQRTQAQRTRLEGMAAPAGVEPSVWASLGPDARSQVATNLMTRKPASLPGAQQNYAMAQTQGYEGSFMDFLAATKAAGTSVDVSVGDSGYKPTTQLGKLMQDRQHWDLQAESPERTRMLDALNAKIAKESGPSNEAQTRADKYATTLNAAERFNELAGLNDNLTGPGAGRWTDLKGSLGFGNEVSGEMRALTAVMETRLGTALSGAAIPKSEWPKYMAQIPTLTDNPEVRAGKMKALRDTMADLERRRAEREGRAPPAATAALPPTAPAVMARYGIDPNAPDARQQLIKILQTKQAGG